MKTPNIKLGAKYLWIPAVPRLREDRLHKEAIPSRGDTPRAQGAETGSKRNI
jgi:hypothetical protein